MIAYNGAFIKQESTGKVLLQECLDPATAQEVVEYCEPEGLQLNYLPGRHALYRPDITKWSELYSSRTGAAVRPGRRPAYLRRSRPDKSADRRGAGTDRPNIRGISASASPDAPMSPSPTSEYLEFMPPTVDKGTALAVVADYYGIAREKVIAFGDAGNDIPRHCLGRPGHRHGERRAGSQSGRETHRPTLR